ncbi:MAG: hypothetical protein ACI8SE_000048 [Bacteroidia bacterium]|jgi:hypothetical protein
MLFTKIFKSGMLRRLLFTFALVISVVTSSVQAQVIDSVRKALTYKPHIVFGLNGKTSIVSGDPYRTMRLFTGLDYNKKIRFELAYNYMPLPAVDKVVVNRTDTITKVNNLRYLGFQTEYTFFRKNRWKLSYPVQIGIGRNRYTERINGSLNVVRKPIVLPVELGVNAVYLLTDWFGLKAGMGVRMSFGKSFSTLSGPYSNFGLALYPGELYGQIKAKTIKLN